MTYATYHIWTIGCQMNVADSQRVAALLEGAGLQRADDVQHADVIILNSCVVRQSAEVKVAGELGTLKGLKRRKPGLFLGLMGCMVTDSTRPSLEQQFPYVDVFFNILETDVLLAKLGLEPEAGGDMAPVAWPGSEAGGDVTARWYPGLPPEFLAAHAAGPTAYVPVIYGCNMTCSYCIVPSRRGRERSRSLAEIIAEARTLADHGMRDITLLGQTVDAYGRDLTLDASTPVWQPSGVDERPRRRPDLADLLAALHEIPGLWRLRYLTSHPLYMSERIIAATAELPKVCPCINIPVQHGHDDILRVMRRGYTVAGYRRLVERIRAAIPGVAVTTDLIVGYPGESDEHFAASYRLVEEMAFDVVHVAAYSPRPGTRAAALRDDVPPEVKKQRLQAIEDVQKGIARRINERLLGTEQQILVEGLVKNRWMGRTPTDKIVFFEDEGQWTGMLATVRITQAGPWSLRGLVQRRTDSALL